MSTTGVTVFESLIARAKLAWLTLWSPISFMFLRNPSRANDLTRCNAVISPPGPELVPEPRGPWDITWDGELYRRKDKYHRSSGGGPFFERFIEIRGTKLSVSAIKQWAASPMVYIVICPAQGGLAVMLEHKASGHCEMRRGEPMNYRSSTVDVKEMVLDLARQGTLDKMLS